MLRCCGREGATYFAVQGPTRPQATSLFQEAGHLRWHASEAGWRTHNNGIVAGKFVDGRDGCGLIEFEMSRLGDFQRNGFGHALEVDRGTSGACSFSNCLCHGLDMAVG